MYILEEWIQGPSKPKLYCNEIHIWRAKLPIPIKIQMSLEKILDESEILRINKFHFSKDKERALVSRGGLRNIISRYLMKEPNKIQFDYAEFGKPYLLNSENLHFSVSHSNQYILYAIANNNFTGIDLEYCKPIINLLSVAQQFCSENEYKKLLATSPEMRTPAFYRCWTRKEAVLKAIGKGLYFSPKQCEVSFLPNEEIRLLTMNGVQQEKRWKLQEINLDHDYIACLATQQPYNKVFLWDLNF